MNKFCCSQICEGRSFSFKTYKTKNYFCNITREYFMLNLTDLDEWFVCLCQEKDT